MTGEIVDHVRVQPGLVTLYSSGDELCFKRLQRAHADHNRLKTRGGHVPAHLRELERQYQAAAYARQRAVS